MFTGSATSIFLDLEHGLSTIICGERVGQYDPLLSKRGEGTVCVKAMFISESSKARSILKVVLSQICSRNYVMGKAQDVHERIPDHKTMIFQLKMPLETLLILSSRDRVAHGSSLKTDVVTRRDHSIMVNCTIQ
ncbi:uncharacterized protein PHALS_06983 [Plasmopara halstedii]|uniref:Uncharacterized protein n=1 Tax=Plasmopara halstedii TaxID=4781 RepID=A0A0P1B4Y5_PLAHL|nr:uncharacterized protein PHALS_06983 [Plasmopara halstedii]CEG49209.1 hypothetical protein PHALS_06983 [Plasmopara halstedii]|eukprot:XP_024585578.1 hypothetical protein PHALS_06983 [Plasmopara halstedii]